MKTKAALGILFFALTCATTSALAGIGDIIRVLDRPLGRFIMQETTEGAELATRIIGGKVTDKDSLMKLIRVLEQPKNAEFAEAFAKRLQKIEDRFVKESAELMESDSRQLLRTVVYEEMGVKRVNLMTRVFKGDGVKFLPERATPEAKSYDLSKEQFLTGADSAVNRASKDVVGKSFAEILTDTHGAIEALRVSLGGTDLIVALQEYVKMAKKMESAVTAASWQHGLMNGDTTYLRLVQDRLARVEAFKPQIENYRRQLESNHEAYAESINRNVQRFRNAGVEGWVANYHTSDDRGYANWVLHKVIEPTYEADGILAGLKRAVENGLAK